MKENKLKLIFTMIVAALSFSTHAQTAEQEAELQKLSKDAFKAVKLACAKENTSKMQITTVSVYKKLGIAYIPSKDGKAAYLLLKQSEWVKASEKLKRAMTDAAYGVETCKATKSEWPTLMIADEKLHPYGSRNFMDFTGWWGN
jgi:deoxyxylulose-5-phosphate synthase